MLPDRNPNFKDFLHPCTERPEPWRTAFGLVLLVAVTLGLVFLVGKYGLDFAENYQQGLGYALGFEWASQSSKRAVFLSFGVILLSLPALWLVMRFVHKRRFITLFSPNGKINRRAYFLAVGFVISIALLAALPALWQGSTEQQLEINIWLRWLVPGLLIIFLQTTTEELIFRGYLLQQFATHFKSRFMWWLLPSILFGLLHYNELAFGENAWLVVGTATLFGLILSDITVRTGNLSVAMGLHFANNVALALLVGIPGQASKLALFLRDVNLRDVEQTRIVLLISLGMMLGFYLIYLLVMRRRR